MTIYLLHGFVSMVLFEQDVLTTMVGVSSPAGRIAILVVGAVGVTLLFGLGPVHAFVAPVCNVKPSRFAPTIAVLLALALGLQLVPSLRYPLAASRQASTLRLNANCEQPVNVTERGLVVLDPGESRARQLTLGGPQLDGLWVRAVIGDEECEAKPQQVSKDTGRRSFSFTHCRKRGRLAALILGTSAGREVQLCGLEVQ